MDALSQTTHVTYCYLASHSQSETAPLTRPTPLPLLERARWSVAGERRRYKFVSAR